MATRWKKHAIAVLGAGLLLGPALVQAQQYPQTQQYPQQQQYPPQQQQQYPPPQQQQYPPPQQYPQGQQYPQQQYPQTQQYPQQQYPQQGPPPMMAPQQIDGLVGRIALYPDPLLAQVLTASTYGNEIPDAATWANQHAYIKGDELARAIREDNLPFDPSVMALLPFPSVLDQMARDMNWTQQLGNAVLAQRGDVMDAVQRLRQSAMSYGYLQNNQYERVVTAGPGDIEIAPVNPGYYYVPTYDPYVVYARPRPGFFVGSAIRFGGGITIGASFSPWGWGGPGFGWRDHAIIIDHHPWERTWVNRGAYVHPYVERRTVVVGPRVEHHDFEHRDFHGDREREHHDR